MSLLNELKNEKAWEDFLEYKINGNNLTGNEEKRLRAFIKNREYLSFSAPSVPEKKIISKIGTDKKRTVYSFPENETWCLKLLTYLLGKYDSKLSGRCFSFRRGITAGTAFSELMKIKGLEQRYALKTDISNYFNSIPEEPLIGILKDIIDDDPPLLDFLSYMLRKNTCISDGNEISEKTGAMAGVPTAAFFADIYLLGLDRMFEKTAVPYFRYSDDILVICESASDAEEKLDIIREYLTGAGLSLSEKKTKIYSPEEGFDFLGFRYFKGQIDLSPVTVDKMKGKIRRKARAVYRRKARKGLTFEKAATEMIRSMDRKFYDLTGDNEYTWTRYYFPVITKTDGLSEIDKYFVEYLRYLYSGRHYKGNYAVSYDDLKALGYTSLTNEYYTRKEESRKLRKM